METFALDGKLGPTHDIAGRGLARTGGAISTGTDKEARIKRIRFVNVVVITWLLGDGGVLVSALKKQAVAAENRRSAAMGTLV